MNHFQPFSPLILSDLKAQQGYARGSAINSGVPGGTPAEEGSCTEVIAYRCDTCEELHEDEDDAECCCGDGGVVSINCPACGAEGFDFRTAADCCMWKDLDAPKRWRIADAVEAGATWQEAIEAETGQSIN